jgi:hypothetical protein
VTMLSANSSLQALVCWRIFLLKQLWQGLWHPIWIKLSAEIVFTLYFFKYKCCRLRWKRVLRVRVWSVTININWKIFSQIFVSVCVVHTYGNIKIKDSLHHTIANSEHYFTIAFSRAFLAFFSAISDSMLSLANSTKRFFLWQCLFDWQWQSMESW